MDKESERTFDAHEFMRVLTVAHGLRNEDEGMQIILDYPKATDVDSSGIVSMDQLLEVAESLRFTPDNIEKALKMVRRSPDLILPEDPTDITYKTVQRSYQLSLLVTLRAAYPTLKFRAPAYETYTHRPGNFYFGIYFLLVEEEERDHRFLWHKYKRTHTEDHHVANFMFREVEHLPITFVNGAIPIEPDARSRFGLDIYVLDPKFLEVCGNHLTELNGIYGASYLKGIEYSKVSNPENRIHAALQTQQAAPK